MLEARRRFVARGHFALIARRVCDLALTQITCDARESDSRVRSVVDVGCGEGYYLGEVRTHLRAYTGVEVSYLGVDSSRDACRMAARRYADMSFAVSDLKDFIPVKDRSVDLLIDIFAPRNVDEFARVLHPSGLVVIVIPQSNHLVELRSTFPLIRIEENKAEHVIDRFCRELRLSHREPVEYELMLGDDDIIDLIVMSPSRRHLTAPLAPISGTLGVTVAVEILTFQPATTGSGIPPPTPP